MVHDLVRKRWATATRPDNPRVVWLSPTQWEAVLVRRITAQLHRCEEETGGRHVVVLSRRGIQTTLYMPTSLRDTFEMR